MLFLISHRGFNSKYKENTLEGIKYALNLNYISGVEFDVRVTKDKRFVLVHDFYIDRVTNSNGLVNHLTLKELLKYNFGTKTYPSKIATLDEVLNIKTNKILLLEIKFSYDEYIKVRKRFIKLIKKYKNKLIYICSFNKKIINDLNNYLNNLLGYISFKNIYYNNIIDFNCINYMFLNKDIKTNNKKLFIWTINSKEDLINIRDDYYIISDYPNKLLD